jgi:hypothetical protein
MGDRNVKTGDPGMGIVAVLIESVNIARTLNNSSEGREV